MGRHSLSTSISGLGPPPPPPPSWPQSPGSRELGDQRGLAWRQVPQGAQHGLSPCPPSSSWCPRSLGRERRALTQARGPPRHVLHSGAPGGALAATTGTSQRGPSTHVRPRAPRAVRSRLSLLCAELRGSEEPVRKRSRLGKGVYVGLQPGSGVSACHRLSGLPAVRPTPSWVPSAPRSKPPACPGSGPTLQRWPLNLRCDLGRLRPMMPPQLPPAEGQEGRGPVMTEGLSRGRAHAALVSGVPPVWAQAGVGHSPSVGSSPTGATACSSSVYGHPQPLPYSRVLGGTGEGWVCVFCHFACSPQAGGWSLGPGPGPLTSVPRPQQGGQSRGGAVEWRAGRAQCPQTRRRAQGRPGRGSSGAR